MGYKEFMEGVDALIMGRTTFETVCGFEIDWPYEQRVFVLSNSLKRVPKEYEGKVELVQGKLNKIIEQIHAQGYCNLYIDGGQTIQSFLKEDLIDEMTITTIPYLLGGGAPLFGDLAARLDFKCVSSTIFLDQVVQNKFVRQR